MGKSFWGRLEAAKHPRGEKAPRKPAARTGGEKRQARLLKMLAKGSPVDAIRLAHRLIGEVRDRRG